MTSRLVASSVAFVSLPMRELRPVGSDVSYLVRDDQMMLGVDGDLRVDTGASSTRRHRAGIRIGERYLLIWSSQHLRLATFKTVHLPLQIIELLPQTARLGSQRLRWLPSVGGVELLQVCATLSSICTMRRSILARVMFLSRLFTAFNLLPSIATLGSSNRPWRDRARQNPAQTWRMARPLSLRKSASGLSSVIQSSTHPGNSVPCSRSRTHRAGIVTRESLRAERFHTARAISGQTQARLDVR